MSGRGGVSVVAEDVRKTFDGVVALDGISFSVEPGEYLAITGPSGCGKSTLLNLVGSLDRPDSGTIVVGGTPLERLDPVEYRAGTVGFVFQLHNLIPTLSALENVQVPLLGRVAGRRTREERARELLAAVGLSHRLDARPATLSGGERQRVAIARALALDPPLLLADEPTGSLDAATGDQIVDLLQSLREERGMTILLVTNDEAVAATADRTLRLTRASVLRSA
jgi:putative ABC transport system ATP-binding protein